MAVQVIGDGNPEGSTFGRSDDLLSLYGATPVVKRADASQVAITDSTGGTVSDTFASGVGETTIALHVNLASIAANGDILTNYTPGYRFKLLGFDFRVCKAATTAAKAASLNLEIGTTDVTGGVIALTSANCTPAGAAVAGSAITAANTGSASDTISIEASGVTAFVEGDGWLLINIQNMDTADAFASLADKWNEVRSALVNLGAITGAA
ncbi:MAG: hypothetical protein ACT4OE_00100 [Sphingosinicella sp.]